jgi:hypothetical protein
MEMEDSEEYIFDFHIIARGSSSLIAKEQQATRLTEFLTTTNNPVDVQIMGMEGRRNLLEQAAKANELDTDKIFPESAGMQPMSMDVPQGQPGEGGGPPAPASLDLAGNKTQGEDTRLISHEAAQAGTGA